MSEKTKNISAILTSVTLFAIAMMWSPFIGVCYLLLLWLVAVTSEDFLSLTVVAAPIVIVYLAFLALFEHKKVVEYLKARWKEIERDYDLY